MAKKIICSDRFRGLDLIADPYCPLDKIYVMGPDGKLYTYELVDVGKENIDYDD